MLCNVTHFLHLALWPLVLQSCLTFPDLLNENDAARQPSER